MVLGVEYYESAFDIIESLRPPNVTVTQRMQTNGTLLSREWCDLIEERRVDIGISIDGPRELHDRNRVTRSGRGTFDRVIAGIRLLRAAGIDFGVIIVLSRASLDSPEALFEFLVSEGIERVCFNMEGVVGSNRGTSLVGDDVYERYREFMARFWALALESGKLRSVREMRVGFGPIFFPSQRAAGRNALIEPLEMLNVDVDGNLSTFSPELLGLKNEQYGDFHFGNVDTHALADVFENPAFRRFHADVRAGAELCARECRYFSVCGGGSPANKLAENGSVVSTETLYCRLSTQLPVDLARELYDNAAPAPRRRRSLRKRAPA
jgi:uncharacterized protein